MNGTTIPPSYLNQVRAHLYDLRLYGAEGISASRPVTIDNPDELHALSTLISAEAPTLIAAVEHLTQERDALRDSIGQRAGAR